MKIFISCSGITSHDVAVALSNWLKSVIQASEPFVYTENLEKGGAWFATLQGELETCDFGILCITPDNIAAPWILFEAGALFKGLADARVVPFLVGVETDELKPPLSHFTATLPSKDDMLRLVVTINRHLPQDRRLSETELGASFDTWWPSLYQKLRTLARRSTAADPFEYDVFLSAPMAAYGVDASYKRDHLEIKKVFDAFKQHSNFRVYWAAEKIESIQDFDLMATSVIDDLRAVQTSRYFVLVYPRKMATSALFEAGYALALKKFSLYFVPNREELPFLMRELPDTLASVRMHTNPEWHTYDDIANIIRKNGAHLFAQARDPD